MHRRLRCCFTNVDQRVLESFQFVMSTEGDPRSRLTYSWVPMLSLQRHCYVMQPALRCAPMQTADRKNSTLLLGRTDALAKYYAGLAYAKLTEKVLGRNRAYLSKSGPYGIYRTRLRVVLVPRPWSWPLCLSHTHTLVHHIASYRIICSRFITCHIECVLPTC